MTNPIDRRLAELDVKLPSAPQPLGVTAEVAS